MLRGDPAKSFFDSIGKENRSAGKRGAWRQVREAGPDGGVGLVLAYGRGITQRSLGRGLKDAKDAKAPHSCRFGCLQGNPHFIEERQVSFEEGL
jgi:hypothetical protein